MLAVDTGIIPRALLNKPNLHTFETDVWNAFSRLSARRTMGGFGAVGAIPYIEISSYLDVVYQVSDEDDRRLFIDLLEFLDNKFLREYAETQKAAASKK